MSNLLANLEALIVGDDKYDIHLSSPTADQMEPDPYDKAMYNVPLRRTKDERSLDAIQQEYNRARVKQNLTALSGGSVR